MKNTMSFTVTPQTFDYNNLFNPVDLGAAIGKAQAYKEAAVVQAQSLIKKGLYDTETLLALAPDQDTTGGVTDLSGVLGAAGSLGSLAVGKIMDRGDGSFGNPFRGDRDAGTRGWIDFTGGGDPNFATSTGRLLGPTDAIDWGF